ncbi:hypothetical protein AAG906_005759 [Vitis piasezkii]
MKWHVDGRMEDEMMRHPADSLAWKNFDNVHPSFALEPRNVRLGLASDGFNPFGNMSISYSMWPVVLIPYNLPPWMCMKQTFFMLSLLIPGPTAPGNDIDIYLQPLIDELNDLWDVGVETYDASTKQNFCMRAAILKFACPICNKDCSSFRLQNGRKWCYMGHRRFLPIDHRFRRDKKSFDGNEEHRAAPKQLSGEDILHQLDGMEHITLGKTSKNKVSAKRKRGHVELEHNWKKKSIFFQLPYWKTLILHHNLDAMHIEKNICDSIVGTLLTIDGKSKDNFNSRLDLQVMEVKVPDGYASNISRCVQVNERKIFGLKSHDCHVLRQQLLPLAIRGVLHKNICVVIVELCSFFKQLCSKVLKTDQLEHLENDIIVTLCKLERIFPPSFFDVMVHLPIHLASEAKVIGRCNIDRCILSSGMYLRTLKSYVRNKSRPEGSIAEGYIAEECTTFCSRYLHDVETKHDREERNYVIENNITNGGLTIFKCMGRTIESQHLVFLAQKNEHKQSIRVKPRIRARDVDLIHTREFISWFEERVSSFTT